MKRQGRSSLGTLKVFVFAVIVYLQTISFHTKLTFKLVAFLILYDSLIIALLLGLNTFIHAVS